MFFFFQEWFGFIISINVLFRIELLSTGVTYNRVAVCKMARASCPMGRLRARSHLLHAAVKEQRLRCANFNAPRGCVLAWIDGITFVAPALEGPCYLSDMCGRVVF